MRERCSTCGRFAGKKRSNLGNFLVWFCKKCKVEWIHGTMSCHKIG